MDKIVMKYPALTMGEVCTPCIIQPKLAGGMSYVIQLADSSFIVIDGGYYNDADVQYLYELLRGKSARNQKPVISMWMFTHPHFDHIELATEFIRAKAVDVKIKAFAYQFPDCDKMNTQENDLEMKRAIALLKSNISNYYPNATVYTLHTGQKYIFSGMEIEILWTGEDIYPYKADHYNDVSAAWRMKFDNGKSFFVLGDCFNYSCRKLVQTYGEYLKSDILQLTHHGLLGGDKELYQLIDPDICFWAVSEERFLGTRPGDKIQYCLGEGGCDYNAWIRDESIRVRKHYHQSVTTVINMD